MKIYLYTLQISFVLAAMLLTACGGSGVVQSKLARNANPDAPAADVDQLVAGNNAFAFDLYQVLAAKDGNLVYSPYSISLALAMTYAGARGNTASQMADSMHFNLPPETFHPAFNTLDLALAGRADELTDISPKERFQLNIANSIWGQAGWSFLPEYLDLLSMNYGAGMHLVDFQKAPDSARREINNWISDQTKKRIQNIIPPDAIDSATRLVLANAIYFKATWEFEFDADNTRDASFTLLDGSPVTVSMMENETSIYVPYTAGQGWQAVALPYKGGSTEMIILVPDAGNYSAFESGLTAQGYADIVNALETQQVILSMPKFTFETETALTDALKSLGMQDAFDRMVADFSGMDGKPDLYITDALHKAFIAVDEKGTEAAAATVVIMGLTGMPMPQGVVLTIDRPFIYFIRDVPTGTILFMGRVLDPR